MEDVAVEHELRRRVRRQGEVEPRADPNRAESRADDCVLLVRREAGTRLHGVDSEVHRVREKADEGSERGVANTAVEALAEAGEVVIDREVVVAAAPVEQAVLEYVSE